MALSFKIAYNSFVQIIGRLMGGLINFAVILIITRELGRFVWADYVTITSFIALFSLIADFGLNAIFVREAAEKPEELDYHFQSMLSLRILLAAATVFITLAVLSFTGHNSTVKLGVVVGVLAVVAQAVSYSINAIFQLKLRFDRAVISDISGSGFLLILVGAFAILNINVLVVVILYLLANLVRVLVGILLVRPYVRLGLSFDWIYAKRLFLLSGAVGVASIFSQFIANIDKQIIALAKYQDSLGQNGRDAVAIYGLSYRIFDFLLSFPAFFINSSFPIMVQKMNSGRKALFSFTKKLAGLLLLGSILVSVFTYFAASVVLPLFGKYPESVLTLRILSIGLPIFFITSLGFSLLIVLRKEKTLPFVYGLAAAFNLVANYYLVPVFGYNAAAYVTWLTELIILLFMAIVLGNYWRSNEAD